MKCASIFHDFNIDNKYIDTNKQQIQWININMNMKFLRTI